MGEMHAVDARGDGPNEKKDGVSVFLLLDLPKSSCLCPSCLLFSVGVIGGGHALGCSGVSLAGNSKGWGGCRGL
jgi:hypothetical protein